MPAARELQSEFAAASIDQSATTELAGDPRSLLESLKIGLRRVEQAAARDNPDEAAAELTAVYMTEFEPLERYLFGRNPQAIRPLEIQFKLVARRFDGGSQGEKPVRASRRRCRLRSRQ